ncbi:DUF4148 domain-containing protein [Paracidovorax citrulli]|uniref:DUF4148 domain-containing protein n=2 Tax=Paracidovorax citrulli TaxID=80869 RepID=A1TLV8_PARC0|nr:DUF4148 domain-containing protein [Paracidovorax citrulli]ABM31946.1 hypothetical protein Aave_1355 [Paracidovorax citrulli AAC00-1]ATG96989.1 DUF4148 domain-containing protein [Paracidovorax citrulli]MVT38365.1 DUF4148 domain-containing protein [Paracidovorax citrulli]PVY66135.1 uncharacterized protein DUF4148 [Paracidovorax citrulli]QCX11878.1 hypothetical protein APS58_3090 [Paracidovorax citrulli]
MAHHPFCLPARTLLRAAAFCAGTLLAATSATAQTAAPAPQGVGTAARPGTGASDKQHGRTRADVIAELACAQASGELESMALQGYGVEGRPIDRSVPECAQQRVLASGDTAQPR